jgi:dihydroorotate dehydrogenase electron transfer subunit
MGVAPLVFLAEKFAVKNKEVMVLLGARDKSGILCERDFSRLKNSVRIATDNGSRGFKGRVSGLLESVLESGTDSGELAIYACGPRPMLREVARLSRESNVTSWLSLEEHMACGLGVCLGCVVDTVDGYKRVCKEGPVFEASRLIWEKRRLKGED